MGFLDLLPTEFDSEIRDVDEVGEHTFESTTDNKSIGFNDALERFHQLKLMTIGCEKGSVIFLSCLDMTKIYCRLTYHRERIISISSIKEYKSTDLNPTNGMIATYCA